MNRWGVAGGCLGSYIGGLLVSLTPCVYPMIVITVSVFGANPTQSRGKAMLLSLSFVLGLCASYTPLVVAAGLTALEPKQLTRPMSGSIRILLAFETCQLKVEVCPGIICERVVLKQWHTGRSPI